MDVHPPVAADDVKCWASNRNIRWYYGCHGDRVTRTPFRPSEFASSVFDNVPDFSTAVLPAMLQLGSIQNLNMLRDSCWIMRIRKTKNLLELENNHPASALECFWLQFPSYEHEFSVGKGGQWVRGRTIYKSGHCHRSACSIKRVPKILKWF